MIWPYFERRKDGFVSLVLRVLFLVLVGAGVGLGAWKGYSAAHKRIQDAPGPACEEPGWWKETGFPEYPMGRRIAFDSGGSWEGFWYIVVDGHQYLAYSDYYRFAFTHSPKCPCHNKEGNENQ